MAVSATIQRAVKSARATKSRPSAVEQWSVTVEMTAGAGKVVGRFSSSVVGTQKDAEEHARYLADDDTLAVTIAD